MTRSGILDRAFDFNPPAFPSKEWRKDMTKPKNYQKRSSQLLKYFQCLVSKPIILQDTLFQKGIQLPKQMCDIANGESMPKHPKKQENKLQIKNNNVESDNTNSNNNSHSKPAVKSQESSTFDGLNALRAKELRQLLRDVGIDPSQFLEKTEMIVALMQHQQQNDHDGDRDDEKRPTTSNKNNVNKQDVNVSRHNNKQNCNSDFDALNKLRVKQLKEYLFDLGIDASQFIDKKEMIYAIMKHQSSMNNNNNNNDIYNNDDHERERRKTKNNNAYAKKNDEKKGDCDPDFATFNKMRVKDLRQYLNDLGIDASKFVEKTEMIDAILNHQRNNGSGSRRNNNNNKKSKNSITKPRIKSQFDHETKQHAYEKKINCTSDWGMLSIKSLCWQLKLETDDEWTDVYNSIYSGVSRLEAIGLIDILSNMFNTRFTTTVKTKSKSKSQSNCVLNLECDSLKENITLIHLFGLIIIKGINITLINKDNKRENIFDLLLNDTNLKDLQQLHCLSRLQLQSPILLFHTPDASLAISLQVSLAANTPGATINGGTWLMDKNHQAWVKQSSSWTIDQRRELIEKLHQCLKNSIAIKEHRNGKERDSVTDVMNALREPNLENGNVLSDNDYTVLKRDFQKYGQAMNNRNNNNSDVYSVLAKASKAVKNSKRNFFPRNVKYIFYFLFFCFLFFYYFLFFIFVFLLFLSLVILLFYFVLFCFLFCFVCCLHA